MNTKILTGIFVAMACLTPAHAQHGQTTSATKGAPEPWRFQPQEVPRWSAHWADESGRFRGYLDPALAAKSYRSALATAECAIAIGGERIARDLSDSDEINTVGVAIYHRYRSCIRQSDVKLGLMMAGAVAETLLEEEGDIAVPERAQHVNVDQAEAFHGDLFAEVVPIANIARCAAVYSPGLAANVLRTDVGSAAEEEALTTLFARTPECGLAGRPSAIPGSIQRGAIAAALYSWTHSRA